MAVQQLSHVMPNGIDERPAPIYELSYDQLQSLCDRLFSFGVSNISTAGSRERADAIAGSRAIRALLRRHEMATGRQLSTVLLAGRV
jgi:hypothetical protein